MLINKENQPLGLFMNNHLFHQSWWSFGVDDWGLLGYCLLMMIAYWGYKNLVAIKAEAQTPQIHLFFHNRELEFAAQKVLNEM